jgi:DNA polymerase-1
MTQTLLGRYRKLDKFFVKGGKSMIGMRKRRAINTPIQGGAADIVIAAMVKIHYNE